MHLADIKIYLILYDFSVTKSIINSYKKIKLPEREA